MLKKYFKKKDDDLIEVFEDLKLIKSHINTIKKELLGLNTLKKEDREKTEELKKLLAIAYEERELIEEHFMRQDGGLYLGSGYEIKELKELPQQVPVFLENSDKSGHFGCQGTTRVGKSVLLMQLVRQNLLAKENVIVIDPKGGKDQEILNGMIEFAYEADMLEYFLYYSLSYPEYSDMLNPFFGMDHAERASMMAIIAGMGNSESFFTNIVYQITYAISLVFEVLELANDPTGEKTNELIERDIQNAKNMRSEKGFRKIIIDQNNNLHKIDAVDRAHVKRNELFLGSEVIHNSTLMNFADLSKYSTFDTFGTLHALLISSTLPDTLDDKAVRNRFETLKASALIESNKIVAYGKDFFAKITPSLSTLLTQMSQGAMGDIFCTVRTNPLTEKLFIENERVVALMHPFPMRFRTISDMTTRLFMLIIDNIIGKVGSTGRGLNARLNAHIDEAKSVAYPGLERTPAVAGGIGISLYFYTQSFADWEDALGSASKAQTLLDNFNTQSRFRMKDEASADRVVKELDYVSVISSSAMVEADGQARMVLNTEERWLAKRTDITKMEIGRTIITTGTKSYILDTPYWSGPKGKIKMPELDFEKRINEVVKKDIIINESFVDQIASANITNSIPIMEPTPIAKTDSSALVEVPENE